MHLSPTEACHVVKVDRKPACHVAKVERKPRWVLDLKKVYFIAAVRITPRLDQSPAEYFGSAERFRPHVPNAEPDSNPASHPDRDP